MYLGKTLILGDSYSTFEGYIPYKFGFWYGLELFKQGVTDVSKVEQTWWYNLFDGKDNILLLNDSYSGTTICNTVRPGSPIALSFIGRLDKLISDDFFSKNRVDTIFIFGGTNDSWIDSPVGENEFENFTSEHLLKVLPACGYLASKLKEISPKAHVCWLINTELKEEITSGMIINAEYFGQDYIRFSEINKMSGHPSIEGMKQIQEAVKQFFKSGC